MGEIFKTESKIIEHMAADARHKEHHCLSKNAWTKVK
ncbi:MAG: hypothetical protein UT56_C0005G0048 [Candidatus Levybacteria bacterium GW2011_GWB1_39_7]|nr:MAG: hypothetical protein UT56_C0005G0048 [Candidatus Levybacteria bacterium GW2011_GWB1_39_7]